MDNHSTTTPRKPMDKDEAINSRRAFWAAIIFTFVALTSFVFSLFLIGNAPIWQVYAITAITVIALVADTVGLTLVWRGQTAQGLKYFYWSLMFTVPLNVLLVTSTTPFLIGIVLVVGYVHVFYLQPRTWRKAYQFGPIVASIFMAVVEIIKPAFRANLTQTTETSGYFGGTILAFLVLSLIVLFLSLGWGNILDFLRASIRNRLTAIVIGAALIPVLLVSIILSLATFNQVQTALTKDAFDKLAAVQTIKANQVTSYLVERQGDMVTLRDTAAALRQAAIAKRQAINDLKSSQLISTFKVWDEDVRDVASDPGVVAGVHALETGFQEIGSAQVRSLYLGNGELSIAADGSAYSTAHLEQYSFFSGYTAIHGYEDAFLVDTTGNVVFSVHKSDLFGSNLVSGPYKDSNLAGLYQVLVKTPANQSAIADAAFLGDKYAMFVGTPVYDGQTLEGMLIYQLPLATINAVLQDRTGLTPSAESFLVGKTANGEIQLRSDRVVKQGLIGDPKPETDGQKALAGESGTDLRVGSTGVYELSVYAPLNIPGLNWAILTTSFANEVFVPQLAGQDKDYLTNIAENYGFFDIFLISPDGFIFYTVAKQADFQTNILTGEYSNTNLGEVVAHAGEVKSFDFADFAPYTPSGGDPAAFLSIPLLDENNNIEMIVAAQVSLEQINALMTESVGLGNTGETYLVGQDELWRNDSRFLSTLGVNTTVLNPDFKVDTIASRSALAGEAGQQQINDYRNVPVLSVWSPITVKKPDAADPQGINWALIAEVDQSEALAPVNQMAGTVATIVGLTVLVIGAVAVFVGTRFALGFVAPIVNLTDTATKVAEGNLNLTVESESEDEIGVLSRSFNSMTSQLRNMIGSLEGRVAERTRNLTLAGEVGRSVSQVRELEVMLHDAAEIIRERFDMYYVQVYLTNPSRTELLMQAGTGTVGQELLSRGHHLPINTASINGRAAVERRPVIIFDTSASATFRPNPLLPDTRSEMAIPLTVGDKVVGVLDLQSATAGSLSQDTLPAFEALAGQLAIAIQNATLLTETEHARAEVEKQAARLARSNWDEYLDAIHKAEHIGFAFEGNEMIPLNEAEDAQPGKNSISSPITVTGEALGSLSIELDEEKQNPQNRELVNIVARQVGQQLENLRLLESAERFRAEADLTARRATIEGWKQYVASRNEEHLGYLYNTNEVVPSSAELESPSLTLPVKAGDETVGQLSVMGLEAQDNESRDLATSVAERLGAHIESLRLFEETRRGQLELDKRARELASVAEISSASARELNVGKMLETVVQLTQRKFDLYHAHVFTYDDITKSLVIRACGWKEGDEHGGTHGTTTIPVDQEQSLVARSARERKAVIVNDVRSDPGWLPNPLLPDTRSEMAVPLIVGEQLLGVLDVQKDIINGFSEEDINVKTTLAIQVATSLQNAQSFFQAQQQAEREAMLNAISQKIQSATTVEAVLQIAARELGHALGAPLTVAQLGLQDRGNGN